MYERFYRLKEKPFALSPDPSFLFLAGPHRRALTQLEYSLVGEAPFCLITGEVGSGKTTVIQHLLKKVKQTVTVGLLCNTDFQGGRLLRWVCMSFGLDYGRADEVEMYQLLIRFLRSEYAKGHKVALIVDEAQNLGRIRLEELRLLSNINTGKQLLLQIILVGQPELRALIRTPKLLQLAQRISADYHMEGLSAEEARLYIMHRVRVAGGRMRLFSDSAIKLAYEGSRGIPRLINQCCDLALVYGYAEGAKWIEGEVMAQAIADRRSSGLMVN